MLKLINCHFREALLAQRVRYSVLRCWLAREGTSWVRWRTGRSSWPMIQRWVGVVLHLSQDHSFFIDRESSIEFHKALNRVFYWSEQWHNKQTNLRLLWGVFVWKTQTELNHLQKLNVTTSALLDKAKNQKWYQF